MPQRKLNRQPSRLAIRVQLETADIRPPVLRWLASQLRRLAEQAKVKRGHLNILIVGDAKMADLHVRYKSTPGTTDVLTFDLRESPAAPLEGDIVLCIDEATRQAAARGHAVRMELLLYALHGLLHLLGYDDHSPADFKRMHRREDELLQAVGFAPVYAAAPSKPTCPKRRRNRL